MEILITGLLVLLALGVAYIAYAISKKKDPSDAVNIAELLESMTQKNERVVKEEMSTNRKEVAESEKRLREELAGLFKGFGDPVERRMTDFATAQNKNFEGFSLKLTELIDKNEAKMERVKEAVEKKLDGIQKDNAEKLEAMRQTVDEKLHATLEKRLGESFKMVSDRLEQVHKGLGEMQTLATGVGDLKKVLTNVKTRGIWGEVQLGNLLEQILTPEQYDKNVICKQGSKERVEFAILLPGKDENKTVLLPIDAKFPQEDYQRLVEAYEHGNLEMIEEAGKNLETRIKGEAKSISEKYIDPPGTTDFGIMFLPYESLYAEVLRRPGLCELIQRTYRVTITGPTTLYALLNSLQMGFRTLAIEKRSSEVWVLLSAVKTEFNRFGGILEKTHKQLQAASHTIEDAARKSRTIERKLKDVQALPQAEATPLIESPLSTDEEDTLALEGDSLDEDSEVNPDKVSL
jgi:DNA recombination protein RmuC